CSVDLTKNTSAGANSLDLGEFCSLANALVLFRWLAREATMKTITSGSIIAFAAIGLLFGTGVEPVQAALFKTSPQPTHHARHAQNHMARHSRTAANQCLAKPGSMRAFFCPSGTAAKK